jgi:GxxExxY protein
MCEENRIAKDVVDAALKLHKHFGAGVYENVYETTLTYELKKRGFSPRNQIPVPLVYDGIAFDVAFKMDVLVNDLVILELKARTGSFQATPYVPASDRSSSRLADQFRRSSAQKRYPPHRKQSLARRLNPAVLHPARPNCRIPSLV